jgi:hypothetical protein
VSVRGVAVGILLFLPVALAGQELGGVRLRLGDPQAKVLASLSGYKLASADRAMNADAKTGFWTVSDTTQWHGEPNYGNVGDLQFVNGRLVSVNRSWGQGFADTPGAIQPAQRLFAELSGQSNCRVTMQPLSDPDMHGDILQVTCGEHSVSLAMFQVGEKWFYGLNENWRHRDQDAPRSR